MTLFNQVVSLKHVVYGRDGGRSQPLLLKMPFDIQCPYLGIKSGFKLLSGFNYCLFYSFTGFFRSRMWPPGELFNQFSLPSL